MNLTGFNAAENRLRICATQRRRLVRRDHQRFGAALLAPRDQAASEPVNRGPFARFDRNDCCFFLASHRVVEKSLGGLLAFAKIQPVRNPLYEFPLKVLF